MPEAASHSPVGRPLDPSEAAELAEAMALFATSSRLRLLWELIDGELPVDELARRTGISQSAVSQQLRLLRQGHLVSARRSGRRAFYSLHDHHIPELMSALRHHLEHVNGRGASSRSPE